MNMSRRLAGAGLALVAAVALTAGVAEASTPTAVNSVACVQATLRVAEAGKVANDAADALAKAQTQIQTALQANVDTAQAALSAAVKDGDPAKIVKAQVDLQNALQALANAAVPSAEKNALTAAQAALQTAINAAATACKDPVTTTPATPTTTTTTAPPTTTTSTSVPPANDEVFTAPVGGVETGLL